jgi:hypothetical protein
MSKPIYVEHNGWRVRFETDAQGWSVEFAMEWNGRRSWFDGNDTPTEMLSKELRDAIEHYRPGQLAIQETEEDA